MVKWESLLVGATVLAISFSAWASKQLEALEKYEISSLSYWHQGPSNCVYILDPEGFMHLALIGSGIGKNHGKITAISSKELEVTELFRSGDGEWYETKATLKAVGRVLPK